MNKIVILASYTQLDIARSMKNVLEIDSKNIVEIIVVTDDVMMYCTGLRHARKIVGCNYLFVIRKTDGTICYRAELLVDMASELGKFIYYFDPKV